MVMKNILRKDIHFLTAWEGENIPKRNRKSVEGAKGNL